MKILYVSQYFPPEMGAPAGRVHELSREWVRAGHRVTVLTGFAHHPTGVKAAGDRGRLTRRERIDGIDVVRCYVFAAPNAGVGKRMVSYASFMLSAAVIGALRVARPDVVVATSPQLLCACAGRALALRFRVPFVFEVRDLWPESILAVEAMQDNWVVRSLKGLARHLYRTSDRIVTVGEGYKRQIERLYGIDPGKMDVVPNGIDPELFSPAPRDNEIRRELGWGDRTVAMYVGTHGMAHALHGVLEAARRLQDVRELLFVFVGEGARKEELVRQAAAAGLDNVQFIGQQPKARVPAFYAACDLGLVTLRRTPLFQEVLPSKIFEYLAMERPLILSVDGEARQLVEAAGAGRFVEPENPEALAAALRELAGDRRRLAEMGRRGRSFVLAHYQRSALAERYARLLAQVVAGRAGAR
jgi:glycosyltransferase involved in cell wall biosynthesis